MIAAKIKVWMLTGDKEETAVNIGYSTGLLDNDVEKIRVTQNTSAKVYKQLNEGQKIMASTKRRCAVILGGEALDHVMHTPNHQRVFVELAGKCETLICSRLSPK